MILYDRARISRKNSWIDNYGNVDEGLLVRKSGGFSKPNHLYVKIPSDEIVLQPIDNKAVKKMAVIESEKHPSSGRKMAVQESEMWHLVK